MYITLNIINHMTSQNIYYHNTIMIFLNKFYIKFSYILLYKLIILCHNLFNIADILSLDISYIHIIFILYMYYIPSKLLPYNSLSHQIPLQRDCLRQGSVLVIKVIRIHATDTASFINLLNSKSMSNLGWTLLYY